jgi:DNA-binding LacI/PurR family transcriptional regulator
MKNRPRLTDVARLAGVSTATVSAVINHSAGNNIRVSADTRQRVWDAVSQLGYVANPAARSLAGGQNRILGIFTYEPIFPFQHHDFFYPFLVGIEEEAEAQGYHLLLFTNVTNSDGQRSIYHDETNLLYMADGSILLGLNDNKEELRRLQSEGYPFVFVGRREVPGAMISYTACDYTSVTAELTCRLAALGHRRLVYVGVSQRYEASLDRENGFLQACSRCGLPLDEFSIVRGPANLFTPDRVKSLIQRGVSGALVEFDDQCQALLTSLRSLGLAVPRDFSIVMLGDPHYAWDHSPNWTMFTIPRREMGVEAVRLLIRRLNQPPGAEPETVSLPGSIVAGQTIGPPLVRIEKEVPEKII